MKKLIVALLALIVCANAETKTSFGLGLRNRMIMSSVGTGTDADGQHMNRYTDFRLRPSMTFQANDMVSANFVMEIGDIKFGTNGAVLGTDGVNIETKHAYIDVKPTKDHQVRLGLMAYYDPHSLILDDDLAGIKYEGTFDQISLGLGYYVTTDGGEINRDKKTWSFGTSLISANLGFKINDKMSTDLTTLTEMTSTVAEGDTAQQANSTNMWFAPRFVGDFGMVNVDATFIYTTRGATSYEKLVATAADMSDAEDDGSGMAFSLKSGIIANEQLTVGVNFLYGSANDVKDSTKNDGYQTAFGNWGYAETGLQIITQGGIGENENIGYDVIFTNYGIMLPVVTVDYAVNPMMSLGGAFGMAMTLEDVTATVDGKEVKDTSLGMEFGLNSKIKLYEKLNLTPYAAFFMPGKGYSYLTNGTDKTDMQMKMGAHLTVSF